MQGGIPRLDPVGRVLGGRYRVANKIGSGGMGSVYEAVQNDLNRKVAIKILHPHLCDDYELVERFRREAQAAAALGHPNIVGVIDFLNDPPDPPFLVLEFLAGQSLRELMDKTGQLAAKRVALLASQALSALGAAHAAGIVHRDIKPDNLFVVPVSARREVVKVLDFGVAKLLKEEFTTGGTLLGTLAYMAPEQARSRNVDGRADLYAIAAVMYHALTGRLPLEAPTHPGMLSAILKEVPKPVLALRPDVDPAFCAIVDRGLNKEPNMRFSSAEEMEHQISSWVDQFQVSGNIPNSIRAARSGTAPMPAVEMAQRKSAPPSRGSTMPISAYPTIPSTGGDKPRSNVAATVVSAFPNATAGLAPAATTPSHVPSAPSYSTSPPPYAAQAGGTRPLSTPPPAVAIAAPFETRPSSIPVSSGYPQPASFAPPTMRSSDTGGKGSGGSGVLVWILVAVGVVSLAAAALIGVFVVLPRYQEQEAPAVDAGQAPPASAAPTAPPPNATATATATATASASASAPTVAPTLSPNGGTANVATFDAATPTLKASRDAGGKAAVVVNTGLKVRVCDQVKTYGGYADSWLIDKTSERLEQIAACYRSAPWSKDKETYVHYTMYVSPEGRVYRTESWANAQLHGCVNTALVGMALGPPRGEAGLVKTCIASWED
jgi:serine/threonine-protein kinase